MAYTHVAGMRSFRFPDLRTLLAKASPARSGDHLAGVAAEDDTERAAAQLALADTPLRDFLNEALIPYEDDEVTRLIMDGHDAEAFAPVASLTVGDFRNFLLGPQADTAALAKLAPGVTPEMAAAVSKIMRVQDLILVARKCSVVTRFRDTIGLPGRLSTRLQPNHPTDDPAGIAASVLDGLLYGSGDAVIGINPATDSVPAVCALLDMLNDVIRQYDIPTQSCVLTHVTTTIEAINRGRPVDLVFQSIAGTEAANRSFGVDLALLREGRDAALALARGTIGDNVMYFETGQGSALSANAHHGVDQQTCEARAYAVARAFKPLLVNTVAGFIGPEYLYNGKQIIRAGLEDHFCGKLLGLPMGCDICYTNHAEADQDDMDMLLTVLPAAGCTFIMGVPGSDDIMLSYQTTSFHDALYARETLGLRMAPEFEDWLLRMGIFDQRFIDGVRRLRPREDPSAAFVPALARIACQVGRIMKPVEADSWTKLRRFTAARIALGRSGVSIPTKPMLEFQLAHARARDAVHLPMDRDGIVARLEATGYSAIELKSAAADRTVYLQRPDLGRRLDDAARARLSSLVEQGAYGFDIAFVIAGGLSALAVNHHAIDMLEAVRPGLVELNWRMAPVCVVEQGRVAIGDEIGGLLGAQIVVILIGERPGLSAPDSLGLYMTYAPRPGLTDAARNCISNVRPDGQSFSLAARCLLYLLVEARRRGLSGVELKDEAGIDALPDAGATTQKNFLIGDEGPD